MNKQILVQEQHLLDALAIVGWGDAVLLSTILNSQLSEELLEKMTLHPAVTVQDELYGLTEAQAQQCLERFERDDYVTYKLWHQRAVAALAERMMGGETAVEAQWLPVYKRLGSALVSDDPPAFSALVQDAAQIPLQQTQSLHLHNYFVGLDYGLQEKFAEALATFAPLLAEASLDDEIRGRTLNSRAIFYRLMGQFEPSFADLQRCLSLWDKLGNQQRKGMTLTNLGFTAYQLQQYEPAETYLQEAVALLEQLGAPRPIYLANMNLGILYRDLGRWDEARQCQERALALQDQGGAQDMMGRTLINIGELLMLQGDLAAALPKFEAAIAAMSTRIWEVDAHLDRGLVLQAQGRLVEATAVYQQAITVAEEIGRREVLAEAYYRLADVLAGMEDHAAASAAFLQAVDVIESTREPIKNEGLKVSLLGRWQQVYEALVLHLLGQGRVAEAFDWAEKARARAFAEALGGEQGTGETVTAVSLQQTLLANTILVSYFTTGVLEHDVPMLQAIPKSNPLRQHLLTEAKTIRFVISRNQITVQDCDLNPNMLTTKSVRGDDPTRFLEPRFTAFASPKLLGGLPATEKLVLVPHGPLHRLPFGGLQTAVSQPLLRTDGPVLTYAPSATVLAQQMGRNGEKTAVFSPSLVVGYHGEAEQTALRYAKAEVETVAGLLGGVGRVDGVVDKGWLRETAVAAPILHFACHGWFNASDPLASYLEIGSGTTLSAREVLQTWRIQAKLVTLSACQSGVSRVLRGDEPMGLIRAFLYAGARAVLVAHWPVEDLPTFLLMRRFYELGAVERQNLASHLRDAQLWLQQVTVGELRNWIGDFGEDGEDQQDLEKRPFAHPRHWAAFTLFGW